MTDRLLPWVRLLGTDRRQLESAEIGEQPDVSGGAERGWRVRLAPGGVLVVRGRRVWPGLVVGAANRLVRAGVCGLAVVVRERGKYGVDRLPAGVDRLDGLPEGGFVLRGEHAAGLQTERGTDGPADGLRFLRSRAAVDRVAVEQHAQIA